MLPIVITLIFALGGALLIIALGLEFVEMWISLKTIEIENEDVARGERHRS